MTTYLRYPHNSKDINICNEETDEIILIVKNDNKELANRISVFLENRNEKSLNEQLLDSLQDIIWFGKKYQEETGERCPEVDRAKDLLKQHFNTQNKAYENQN